MDIQEKISKRIVETKKFENCVYGYDKNGIAIYRKKPNGIEEWYEYDENSNHLIYFENSRGFAVWREYDEKGNQIHIKHSTGYEEWREYDEQGNEVYCKNSNGYVLRKKYDKYGRCIDYITEKINII